MSLQESLTTVEQLLEKMSAALLASDAQAVQAHSTALRDAASVFAQEVEHASRKGQPPLPVAIRRRMDAVASQMAMQREGIARLSVVTDRQVVTLVPQADSSSTTYDNGLGLRATKPGVARIYRSPG